MEKIFAENAHPPKLTSENGMNLLKCLCADYHKEVLLKEIMAEDHKHERVENIPLFHYLLPQQKYELIGDFLRRVLVQSAPPIEGSILSGATYLTLIEYLKDKIEEETRNEIISGKDPDHLRIVKETDYFESDFDVIHKLTKTNNEKNIKGDQVFLNWVEESLRSIYQKGNEEEDKKVPETREEVIEFHRLYNWRFQVQKIVKEILGDWVSPTLYKCNRNLTWFSIIVFITQFVDHKKLLGILPFQAMEPKLHKILYGKLPRIYEDGDEMTSKSVRVDYTVLKIIEHTKEFESRYKRDMLYFNEMLITLLCGKLNSIEYCKGVIDSNTPDSEGRLSVNMNDLKSAMFELQIHTEIASRYHGKYTIENISRIFDSMVHTQNCFNFVPNSLYELQKMDQEKYKDFLEKDGDLGKITKFAGQILLEYRPQDLKRLVCVFPCLSCSKRKGVKMKICTGCRVARYCSNQCQVKDWKRHKPNCTKWRGLKRDI